MSRPTIHDVAVSAGVSLATVDRVLNGRGGVAEKSMRRVHEAVQALGYVRDSNAANLSRSRQDRLLFLVPTGAEGFAQALRAAILDQAQHLRAHRVLIEERPSYIFDAAAQVAQLRRVEPGDWDAMAIMAIDTPETRAELERLRNAGLPVVALVASLPAAVRDAYVGIDNGQAGRMAGYMAGRFARRRGRVLTIAGSLAAHDHAERIAGFRAVIGDQFPDLTLSPPQESSDDPDRAATLTRAALDQGDLAILYHCGDGNRGLIAALADGADRPVTVLHELNHAARQGLRSGTVDVVIDQDPVAKVARAIAVMRALIEKQTLSAEAGLLEPRLYVKENT